MLKNHGGRKPKSVLLEEKVWRDLMNEILNGIKKNIAVLRSMVSTKLDEYVCAGLYTFALEEFGKLLLLQRSPKRMSNKREIRYASEFTIHEVKFSSALDYLQTK